MTGRGQCGQKLTKIPGLNGGQAFINQMALRVLCVTVDEPVLSSEILCTWEKEKKRNLSNCIGGFPRLLRRCPVLCECSWFSKLLSED